MWRHFETFHVIQQPTYAAKFPPGQGLSLAIGAKLKLPIMGAWLGVAAGCAAVTWMLIGAMPGPWAMTGGLLTAILPVVFRWGQNYWGGGVAMVGGALLGGAALRIARRPGFLTGIIAGSAMAILANSRPFEGSILTLILSVLIVAAVHRRRAMRLLLMRSLPGTCIVLIPAAAATGYYNWRVTNNPLQFPYVLHASQYMIAPLTFFQKPTPAQAYRHEIMRRFHFDDEYQAYLKQSTRTGFFEAVKEKSFGLARDYIDPLTLGIPLIVALTLVRRNRLARWGMIVCLGLPACQMASTPWMRDQYMAPAVGFFIASLMLGMRRIWLMHSRMLGSIIVVCLVLIQIGGGAMRALDYVHTHTLPFGQYREALIEELKGRQEGPFLVLVRYSDGHSPLDEMVYNAADIDSSDVVFARDMGDENNQELRQYFHERQTVLLEPDIGKITFLPPT